MEKDLEKCMIEFIVSRCSTALQESDEYIKLQAEECSKEELMDSALIIGYKKGASDMLSILKVIQPQNTAK